MQSTSCRTENISSTEAKRDGTQLSNAARMRPEERIDLVKKLGELSH
jgi:hypothetical protein